MRSAKLAAAILLLVLTPIVAKATSASEATPSPIRVVLTDWLAAFNSGDLEAVRRFNAEHGQTGAPEETVDWRSQTGGYELVAVEREKAGKLVARLRDVRDPDEALLLSIAFDGAAAKPVPVLKFEPVEIPRRDEAEAIAALVARIDAHAEAGEFAGAILVARKDKLLLRRAWGLADRDAATPNSPETRFRLGSANKMFTSVAVLQLVDAGKLALDGVIGRYLPDYPHAGIRDSVTIADLLTHQAGLVDIEFSDSEGLSPVTYPLLRDSLQTHTDYLARYGPRPPLSKPREKIEYNSFAFVVLGAIIERVSGQSYYDYVQEYVFAPAGMTSTGSLPENTEVPARAVGYTQRNGAWVANHDTVPYRGTAAGGGYSTIDDLLRFARALQAGKLLSPAMLAKATQPQISENWYGYGFITVGNGPLRRYGHGGDAPGMNADVRIFPESGYVLVSLSNLDPPAAYRAFRYYEPRMPLTAVARGTRGR